MSFTKHHIEAEIYHIIDIGSYKIRGISAKFENSQIEVLRYCEKRQDSSYFINNECRNFTGLSENICDLISLLESKNTSPNARLVFNYPFGEISTKLQGINVKRSFPHIPLNTTELEELISSAAQLYIKKIDSEMYEQYGRAITDMQSIVSHIHEIQIDNSSKKNILGEEGEMIHIRLQNVFIPKNRYASLLALGNSTHRKLYKVLPYEYCLAKILPLHDICLIDIGSSSTSIIIKKKGEIHMIVKIPLGIGNLIEKIKKNSSISKSEIIEKLDNDTEFRSEKKIFLEIWEQSIGIALAEILEGDICPHYFFLSGGGNNNNFIHQTITNMSFGKYDVKLGKKATIVSYDIGELLPHMIHIPLKYVEHIPLSLVAALGEIHNISSHRSHVVGYSLEKIFKNI